MLFFNIGCILTATILVFSVKKALINYFNLLLIIFLTKKYILYIGHIIFN
ncbi:hypothetical protein sm9_0865 [Methanobrevibacter millerae]|uniref:Uncharacterized protein n=1 Tax=Methanobrevibacter millerae TaxID=230361 RepID=A0A0U3E6S8_9EURY|nr:hypothetical protein sm9_0865 [Methanobrevibacter millerae]